MRHEEFEEALYSFYDRELSGQKRLELEEHLKACAECSRRLEHWSKIAQAFFAPEKLDVSEGFARRVMQRIGRLEPAGQGAPAFYRWLFPAFGLGLAVFLFFAILPETAEWVSAEDLLLVDGTEAAASELAFLPSAPGQDEILGYALEEP